MEIKFICSQNYNYDFYFIIALSPFKISDKEEIWGCIAFDSVIALLILFNQIASKHVILRFYF